MACPYLNQGAFSCSCGTKEVNFSIIGEKLTDFCENPDKFKKCTTFKERLRIQRAPLTNKYIVFSISILLYFHILSFALIFEIINKDDWITFAIGFISSVLIGFFQSLKA